MVSSVRLRRSVWARCRVLGFPELAITLALAVGALSAPAVFTDDIYSLRDRLLLGLLLGVGIVVRAGIALEWAVATAEGISWTTVFVESSYRWDEVRFVESSPIPMMRGAIPGVNVGVTRSGYPDSWCVRASLMGRPADRAAFVTAAEELRRQALATETSP